MFVADKGVTGRRTCEKTLGEGARGVGAGKSRDTRNEGGLVGCMVRRAREKNDNIKTKQQVGQASGKK